MPKHSILIVDDEESQRILLADYLIKQGFKIATAASGQEALVKSSDSYFEAALVDLKMPGMDGIELLQQLRQHNPELQVIVITAFGTVQTAVEAIRVGAFHYITKPIDLSILMATLKQALEKQVLLSENRYLKEKLEESYRDEFIVGDSENIQQVLSTVTRVAPSDSTILVRGESGTGKELVARAIHRLSPRAGKRFIAINCAALPETLLESELFGHEKGAFTGALRQKQGRFELADGGTLFLDEIGDLSPALQVKLLRALESHEIERLGACDPTPVDVRLICATHQNLEEKIKERTFREDLYYRLKVIEIFIPPLRQRRQDLPRLVEHFLKKFNSRLNKKITGLTPEAKQMLLAYDYPGNVRELENIIERAVVLSRSEVIDTDDLPLLLPAPQREKQATDIEPIRLDELERLHIVKMLKRNNWNLGHTAELLGIHRNTLRLKMKEYGITAKE